MEAEIPAMPPPITIALLLKGSGEQLFPMSFTPKLLLDEIPNSKSQIPNKLQFQMT
jgi:hypothetical protein